MCRTQANNLPMYANRFLDEHYLINHLLNLCAHRDASLILALAQPIDLVRWEFEGELSKLLIYR